MPKCVANIRDINFTEPWHTAQWGALIDSIWISLPPRLTLPMLSLVVAPLVSDVFRKRFCSCFAPSSSLPSSSRRGCKTMSVSLSQVIAHRYSYGSGHSNHSKINFAPPGFERFSEYRGYSKSFRYGGNHEDNIPVDNRSMHRRSRLVAMDAQHFGRNPDAQYEMRNIKRELNKAYVGFYNEG